MNVQDKLQSTNPLTGDAVHKSIKPLDLKNFTKDDVKNYFNNSYSLYETLFTSLKYDYVYYLCPDRLRLPLIFYYGHTAAVFMNKLCIAGLIKPEERVNLEYETTFETGVDEMSWDDTEHYRMGGSYNWPTVQEVKEYRRGVRELINKVIDRTPLQLPVTPENDWWVFFLGFEHERIHYETSTVLIRQYPIEMVTKPLGWIYAPSKLNKEVGILNNHLIKVPETNVRLGKDYDYPSFGWDNEYGRVDCKVSAFEASKFKVTNEEFLEFVLNDGYNTRQYWSDDGWDWVQFKKAKHPLFWICTQNCKSGCGGLIASHSHCQEQYFTLSEIDQLLNEKNQNGINNNHHNSDTILRIDENGNHELKEFPFKLRLMFNIIQMPKNWPVECNYHEAKAFCKWKGEDYRMLSEAEEHAIRDDETFELNTSNDIIYQTNSKTNHNLAFGSPTPVNMYPSNNKGFHDTYGNIWEWTEDHFNGLPGGKTHFLYDDFSTPCYDGRHNIIMGGSWASTGDEASRFARFMFRRHFYQHCGFRLARSLPTTDGSKPNPQFRLIADRIFILGGTTPENKIDLDESKLVLSFFKTTNKQYYYDSILHQDLFDAEMLYQHDENESKWFQPFMSEIKNLLNQHKIKSNTATHIGCSTGRTAFELTNIFDEVIGIDFCGKFLDIALKLQSAGKLDVALNTLNNRKINLDITDNLNVSKAIFKQMTWIPNEIPKSDLVLFTMIDRVMNEKSWLRRFREIVKPEGLLIIQSKVSKWKGNQLSNELNEFDLISEKSIMGNDSLTIWRKKNTC